jgi:hypothetical protein
LFLSSQLDGAVREPRQLQSSLFYEKFHGKCDVAVAGRANAPLTFSGNASIGMSKPRMVSMHRVFQTLVIASS